MGVGPLDLSQVSLALIGTNFDGSNVPANIFAYYPSVAPYITFALSRSFDNGLTNGGVFTVGEVNETYSAITSNPKLPVVDSGRWVVPLDGIITNGQNMTGGSNL